MMKNKVLSIILALVMILVMLPAASADYEEVIYGAGLWVDVPVNGLPLGGKSDAEISGAYTTQSTLLTFPDPMDNIFQTQSVTWYDMANPSVALAEGTQAKLGKTYRVRVQMKIRDLFFIHSDLEKHPGTLVNGQPADRVSLYTRDGAQWVEYEKTFQTIEKSNTAPQVTIQKMELNPYEGIPAEILLQVTGGTNVRYQWQLVYGGGQGSGGLDFSGVINLADDARYQGTRTPHLKIHSTFGDTFYENTFFKLRCCITSDSGKLYSEPLWYSLKDRQLISGDIHISVLGLPKIGRAPDKIGFAVSGEQCQVTKAEWYSLQDDSLMEENDVFREGQYRCRIYISAADAWKFGPSTKVYLNGVPAAFTTISGSDQIIRSADSYYIEGVFTAVSGENIVGDLTDDGAVDNQDVEYLLWYTLFPGDYGLNQSGDFDQDGYTDNKDVEYLLWHTLFPNDYPLN